MRDDKRWISIKQVVIASENRFALIIESFFPNLNRIQRQAHDAYDSPVAQLSFRAH
jgi:hypothetical protein